MIRPFCMWCRKSRKEVRVIVENELGFAICDQCIEHASAPDINGDRWFWCDSDKRMDTVYDERAAILCAFVKFCVALNISCHIAKHSASNSSWDPIWMNIIVVNLPTGQCTWHVSETQLQQFSFLTFDANFVWDGHTTPEKYDKLANVDIARIVDAFAGDMSRHG